MTDEPKKKPTPGSELPTCDADQSTSTPPPESPIKNFHTHDGVFRFAFGQKKIAESFIRERLPEEITRDLDFSSMKLKNGYLVDKQISRSESDVLYSIDFRAEPAFAYLLFEHKSWHPNFPGVQLLKNMARIWEKYLVDKPKAGVLPPIIPLIVYHGKKPWQVDTRFAAMFTVPAALEKYIPAFQYEVTDVSHMPEGQIRGIAALKIILLAFRYIFNKDLLMRLSEIFRLFSKLDKPEEYNQFLELVLIYITAHIQKSEHLRLQAIIDSVITEGGEKMGTIYQELINEGKELGVKEGKELGEENAAIRIALNGLRKGFDTRTIVDLTGLPLNRVENLQATFKQGNAAHP